MSVAAAAQGYPSVSENNERTMDQALLQLSALEMRRAIHSVMIIQIAVPFGHSDSKIQQNAPNSMPEIKGIKS